MGQSGQPGLGQGQLPAREDRLGSKGLLSSGKTHLEMFLDPHPDITVPKNYTTEILFREIPRLGPALCTVDEAALAVCCIGVPTVSIPM